MCFLSREYIKELCDKYPTLHTNLESHAHMSRAREAGHERSRHLGRSFVGENDGKHDLNLYSK